MELIGNELTSLDTECDSDFPHTPAVTVIFKLPIAFPAALQVTIVSDLQSVATAAVLSDRALQQYLLTPKLVPLIVKLPPPAAW